MKKTLLFAALLLLAILSSASLHLWVKGRDAMAASDAALAKGDVRGSIASAKDAAQARLPFSPWPEKGRARLSDLAREAEAKNDFETATIALRALWASCVSTTIGGPDPCAKDAENGIARIAARTGTAEVPGEEPTGIPVWLPAIVLAIAIALVVAASRKRK